MFSRRNFFRGIAALAALPLVRKIPFAQQLGVWATVRVEAGAITSITIINAGSGYTSPPVQIGTLGGVPLIADMELSPPERTRTP